MRDLHTHWEQAGNTRKMVQLSMQPNSDDTVVRLHIIWMWFVSTKTSPISVYEPGGDLDFRVKNSTKICPTLSFTSYIVKLKQSYSS